MTRGRFFEDFTVGDVYKHWPGRTITEFDDIIFCGLTMNTNPLHFDANYASHSQHGRRLTVGLLVLSLVVGMSVADTSLNAIANLEFENVKHLAPTFHGDTIYSASRVLDKREAGNKPDRGIVYLETIGYNQEGKTVLTLKRKFLIPKKEAAGHALPEEPPLPSGWPDMR